MKKTLVFIFLTLMIIYNINANDAILKLKNKLETWTGREKALALIDLSKLLTEESSKEAIKYAQQSLDLLKTLNDL